MNKSYQSGLLNTIAQIILIWHSKHLRSVKQENNMFLSQHVSVLIFINSNLMGQLMRDCFRFTGSVDMRQIT